MLSEAQQRRQTRIGLALAGAIILAFVALHVWSVFFLTLGGWNWALAVPVVATSTWLSVGLFIIAHDAMHGSLAPGRPRVNLLVGRLTLLLYAGFWMDRLRPKHFDHHKHVGTEGDPDFAADHPTRFWPWYLQFMVRYFGLREFLVLSVLVWSYVLILGAPLGNLLLFWALPSILSSLQLFYFGTFLPHRHEDDPFADEHRARSNDFGVVASLLTCFHFGYHREHHLSPGTPWWALPSKRRELSL
ncbi:beta-carotene ketolase (CrtW type) [Sphingomonas kaistensis]|uniref:Beta-carotene ketolase (CrtW type) n=2 Tax=Sphingomonas kaistensis TaxID=298708 RepID=A0A7X5Y8X5_9SPHN|nr:fatty acid desaturase [Sphingomonas kaistensis]NJC06070.1 beta-carotene ketolase (CrtW type) [Sphingomonas kaistensis]